METLSAVFVAGLAFEILTVVLAIALILAIVRMKRGIRQRLQKTTPKFKPIGNVKSFMKKETDL